MLSLHMKNKCSEWEKIFGNHISDKSLVSMSYNELFHLNNKKANNPILEQSIIVQLIIGTIRKRAKDLNRHFSGKGI